MSTESPGPPSSSMEMAAETLEFVLECSVCLDPLTTSHKVLPCQHTFCVQCLQVSVQCKGSQTGKKYGVIFKKVEYEPFPGPCLKFTKFRPELSDLCLFVISSNVTHTMSLIKPYPAWSLIIHIFNGSGSFHEWMTKAEVIPRKYLMPQEGRLLMINLIKAKQMWNLFSGLVCQEEGGGHAVPRVPHAVPRAAAEPALQCHPEPYSRGRNVGQKERKIPGAMQWVSVMLHYLPYRQNIPWGVFV